MGKQPFIRQVVRTTLLVICVFWLLVSCNGGGGRSAPGGLPLQSITVSPSNAAVALGKDQQFTATAHYSDGSLKPLPEATWRTSAPELIMVTSKGLATLVAQGQFGVFATSGKITGSATLTVGPPPSIADELPSRCPTPSKEVQVTCRAITYGDLPNGARGLFARTEMRRRPGKFLQLWKRRRSKRRRLAGISILLPRGAPRSLWSCSYRKDRIGMEGPDCKGRDVGL
jgi:hypothetical protein